MKYLKKFNESIKDDDIIKDIKDLLAELKDDGFNVEIRKSLLEPGTIIVNIFIRNKDGNTQSVSKWIPNMRDRILELIDYMNSEGYDYYIFSTKSLSLDEYEKELKHWQLQSQGIFQIKFELKK